MNNKRKDDIIEKNFNLYWNGANKYMANKNNKELRDVKTNNISKNLNHQNFDKYNHPFDNTSGNNKSSKSNKKVNKWDMLKNNNVNDNEEILSNLIRTIIISNE